MDYIISCTVDQQQIIDKLNSSGAKVIQTSNGLVCKSDLAMTEINALLDNLNCSVAKADKVSDYSLDVQKFIAEG